ncbi:hypothetical protein D3C72_1242370 [compost metagenome]
MRIRFALPKDLNSCRKLDRDLKPVQLKKKIAAKEVVVALVADEVVGYLRIEWFWLKIPYLTWIYVEPAYRENEIAIEMLTFLRGKLKAQGKKILLSSYQDNASLAKRWHRKAGFKKCGKINSINADGSTEIFCHLPC